MKKITILFLALALVSFLLVGCDNTPTVEPAPEHTHAYGAWVSDDTNHWKACECGEKAEIAAHAWNNGEVTTPATETTAGVKTYTCTVCNKTKTESIGALGHEYGSWIEEVAATCTADGTVGHYHCSCGKDFDINYNEITSLVIPATGHNYGTLVAEVAATCETKGVNAHYKCSACDKYFDEAKEEIALADLELDYAEHTLGEWVEATTPECGVDGTLGHYQCSVCEKYFDDEMNELSSIVDEAEEHELKLVPAVAPTCTEAGSISYYLCENCNKKYAYSSEKLTLPAHCEWSVAYPFGNFNDAASYIIGEGVNSYLKLDPVVWGQMTSMTKDTGPELTKAGTYIISIDVKAGPNVEAVTKGKLDIHFNYNGGFIRVSDGVFNLGNVTNTKWTTLEFEFTVPEGISNDWSNFVFYNWPEVDLNDNYVLIDNLVVYAKGDETKTNLDTLGRGDFEGFIELVEVTDVIVAAGHNYGSWVEAKAPDCENDGSVAHYKCSVCNKYFDAEKNELAESEVIIPALTHEYGEVTYAWTVDNSECSATVKCTRSGCEHVVTEKATITSEVTKEPTFTENGERTYTATFANELFENQTKVVVEYSEHEHEYVLKDELAATCTEDGLASHYLCEVCSTYFDLDKNVVKHADLIIPAAHLYGELIAVTTSSCTEAGVAAHYACACGKYFDAEKNEVAYESLLLPLLSHNLTLVPYKAPTLTEAGNIEHLLCSVCNGKFLYNNDKPITLPANSGWNVAYPYGNFAGSPAYIATNGTNSYLHIQPTAWYPTQTGFTKDTGARLAQAGTYVLSFDILGSPAVLDAIHKAKLDIHINYNGGWSPVSDGVKNLTTVTAGWTTLEFEFTVPEGIVSDFTNFTFYYWCEDTLEANYLLIDNFVVYAKGDETKTNLDEHGRGDFEGFIELVEADDVVIAPHTHTYSELVAEQAATCLDKGLAAHYTCNCGKYFDSEKNETTLEALAIPALGHDLVAVAYKAATTEEDGNIEHFDCTRCEENFVYEGTLTFPAQSQWNVRHPWGNYTDAAYYVIGEGANTYVKLDPVVWGQLTGLIKDTGATIARPGTYVLSIDVKAGPNEEAAKAGKLDIQFDYENGTRIIISDGVFNLGGISSANWTTLTFEFTVPEGATGNWSNFVFFNWAEVSLDGNYLLIDNFMVYAKGDETKTNLDACGFGDLEGLIQLVPARNVVISKHVHEFTNLIPEVPATCLDKGLAAHYECACGKYFDAEKNEKTLEELAIPELGHEVEYVEEKVATLEENGNIAHYACTRCGETYLYSEDRITLGAHCDWNVLYPWGNFTDAAYYIEAEGGNSYVRIQPMVWGQLTGLTKDTGALLAKPGTYILSIDVKGGDRIEAVKAGKLDVHFNYENGATIVISDGQFNLGGITNTGWTTLTFEFTVPEGANGTWSNFVFYNWAEQSLVDNYLLIDNLVVYAKGDESLINLDEKGHGDLEGYIRKVVVAKELVTTHVHVSEELVPLTEATCATPGVAAHYRCEVCEAYLDEAKNLTSLEALSTVIPHQLTYVAAKEATAEENGYVSHFHCSVCQLDYVYAEEVFTLKADTSWGGAKAPYCTEGSENDSYIVKVSDTNSALKIKTQRTWPVENIFKKDLNGSLNVPGKTYKLLIDVKDGEDGIGKTCDLNIFYYCPTVGGVGRVVVTEGGKKLSSITSDGWTTLEFEFTIPADALMDWANIEFMFWSEGDINSPGNYILVDNIKIVDVADETRTNLDTIGRGDFEGYLSYVVLKEEDKIIAKLA